LKSIAITGEKRVAVVERLEPRAKNDIVKVQLQVVPMCTEFKSYSSGSISDRLGHEASGVVVDAGTSARVHDGQRVVVMPQYGCGVCINCTRGEHIFCPNQRDVLTETGSEYGTATFAEYLIKPDWLLLPVPEDVSLRDGAMACCALGPSFNAMKTMRVSAADTVLVIGCGPVGLGAVINAAFRGARVIAIDVNPYRLRLAERVGAVASLDASAPGTASRILDINRGRGVDAVFDSTGMPSSVELLEAVVRPRARASFVVMNVPTEFHRLVALGLEVHGCWHWNHQRHAPGMFEVIRRSGDALKALVTHEFPLENVEEAFQIQLSGACGKVLLLPFGKETS
jgi:L-iditol 2-dehydrogenase